MDGPHFDQKPFGDEHKDVIEDESNKSINLDYGNNTSKVGLTDPSHRV